MESRNKLILFFVWAAFIMIAVGLPGGYIPKPIGFLSLISPDKIVHLGLFAPLSIFLLNYIKSTDYSNTFTKYSYIWALICGIVYAIMTELLQFYVFIGRNGNLYDALADMGGAGLGVVVYHKWINKFHG